MTALSKSKNWRAATTGEDSNTSSLGITLMPCCRMFDHDLQVCPRSSQLCTRTHTTSCSDRLTSASQEEREWYVTNSCATLIQSRDCDYHVSFCSRPIMSPPSDECFKYATTNRFKSFRWYVSRVVVLAHFASSSPPSHLPLFPFIF